MNPLRPEITGKIVRDTYLRRRRKRRLSVNGWNGVFTDDLTGTLTLTTSVASRQCYQVGGQGIVFSGTYSLDGTPTGIAYRVGSSAWKQLSAETIGGGSWSGTAYFNGGYGQGNLEFRPINGASVVITAATVANITASNIIAIIGQSNAIGAGTNNQTYTKVNYDWTVYADNTFGTKLGDPWYTGAGGSPWPDLAEFLDAAGIPPVFVKGHTVSGSGFVTGEWVKPAGAAYIAAEADLDAANTGGYRVMLWDQGERDAKNSQTAAGYESALSALVDNLQADVPELAGVKLMTIVLGEVDTPDALDEVREAQVNCYLNDADILPGPNLILEDYADDLHAGTGSNDAQLARKAAMWWRCIEAAFYGGSDTAYGPRIVSTSHLAGHKIRVTFDRAMQNHTDTTGWSLTDDSGGLGVSSAAAATVNVANDSVDLTVSRPRDGAVTVKFGLGDIPGGTLVDNGTDADLPPEVDTGTSAGEYLAAPTVLTAPAVTGAPQESVAYSCTNGTYEGGPEPTVGSFQWQRSDDGSTGWADISGATSATYTPVSGDVGKYIRRGEIASNSQGSTSRQYSNASDQIVAAPSFAFQDLFAGTNGTDLTAHTPDVDESGLGWSANNGTIELQSGRARVAGATPAAPQYVYTMDTGPADGTLEVTAYHGAGTDNTGLAFRRSDNSNLWFCGIRDVEGRLWKRVGGTNQTMAIWTRSGSGAGNAVLRVEMSGNQIEIYEDDALVVVVEDSFNNTATDHGLWSISNAAANEWDGFTFDETANLTITTTAFADVFSGTNGDSLDAHTPGTDLSSLGWTKQNGNIEIQTNAAARASEASPGGPLWVATFEGGNANGVIQADITTAAGAHGLVFRYQDDDNMWAVLLVTSGTCNIYRRAAGSWNSEATFGSVSGTVTLRVAFCNNHINVWVDGAHVAIANNAAFNTETEHGMRFADNASARVDNLTFKR